MSDAGPSECLPTVRSRKPLGRLEWQWPRRFSFACLLKIPGPETDFQDKAIVFSWSPLSDRSRGDEACSGTVRNAVATLNNGMTTDSRAHRVHFHIRRNVSLVDCLKATTA